MRRGKEGTVKPSTDESTDIDPAELLIDEPRRHAIVWVVYALLFAVAIPWYWPAGTRGSLILGLPMWVAITLASVVALAAWTAFVIHRYWHEVDGS